MMKKNKGVTLIALIITIIVLLILAGIGITMISGHNGIMSRAKEAQNATAYKSAEEKVKLATAEAYTEAVARGEELTVQSFASKLSAYNGRVVGVNFPVMAILDEFEFEVENNGNVITDDSDFSGEIPEGFEIGSEIKYEPSGTYNWQAEYFSSKQADDVILNSAESDYKISDWKVLEIANGKVTLVPSSTTTGKVYLEGEQGYNNGVKLLNDACSSLYGNSDKGISARSINVNDIETYMTQEALEKVHSYENMVTHTKYGNQLIRPYQPCKSYPSIYPKENLSVIISNDNTTIENKNGLGVNEQSKFIEKTNNGAVIESVNLQPYQTYWEISYKESDFRENDKGESFYKLILPQGSNYWIASRCIDNSSVCCWGIRLIGGGGMFSSVMATANGGNCSVSYLGLFPVITLNANNIKGDATSGFYIE